MSDPAPALRHTALLLLGNMPLKDAFPLYREALHDTDPENRRLAVSQLAELPLASTFELLLQALQDPAASVRLAAIPALQDSKDPRIIPPLVACIRAVTPVDVESVQLNKAVIVALRRFRSPLPVAQLVARLPGAEPGLHASLITALGQMWNDAAIAPLLAAVGDPGAVIRASAVVGLAHFTNSTAVPGLLAALYDTDTTVRLYAAQGMESLATSRLEVDDLRPALASLRNCLKDPDSVVCAAAINALVALHDPDATPLFLSLLDDPNAAKIHEHLLLAR